MTNIHLGDIRYNAALGTFEALVNVQKSGRRYSYPCAIPAALNLEPGAVRAGLLAQAEARSKHRGGLHSVF